MPILTPKGMTTVSTSSDELIIERLHDVIAQWEHAEPPPELGPGDA